MQKPARCACGEALDPGDRAGFVGGRGKPLCLRCLADLQAGRDRPRRRTASLQPERPRPQQPQRKRRSTKAAAARQPRPWTALVVAAVVVLVPVGAGYVRSAVMGGSVSIAASKEKTRDIREVWPPVPTDASPLSLGMPPAKASSSTEFSFIKTVAGADGSRPIAWDPCRPIHLVVNDAMAPADSDRLLREATARLTSATGLQFVFDGPTTEAPTAGRAPENEALYGDKWSPVLVAWSDSRTIPKLAGAVAGLAGPEGAPFYNTGQEHWVSGSVDLDGPQLASALSRPGGWEIGRAVVMHEFGHLVGLQHVPEPSELMYARTTGQTDFGPGDREGLRQLGLGPCFSN